MASRFLCAGDAGYPSALHQSGSPKLYLRGVLPRVPGVAIVGKRDASVEATHFARELARALCELGFAVWSGGALGIDAAAHAGALAAHGATVVVCGAGLDMPYPREHEPLYARILQAGGALLARVPDDALPLRHHFLDRNEVLAAATVATVVVEAGVKSGARSTAAHARRLGRPVCVVPHAPWTFRGAGCVAELIAGALPIRGVADVLAAIDGPLPAPQPRRGSPRRQLSLALSPRPITGASAATRPGATAPRANDPACASPPRRPGAAAGDENALGRPSSPLEAVLAALADEPVHVDQVCEMAQLTPSQVAEALLTLTLQAVVVEGPAGLYRRV